MASDTALPQSIDATQALLREHNYLADNVLATLVFLGLKMAKPLFLEGEAGVGKTEIAKTLANALNRPLIRLQCYEGLEVNTAVYEWNYPAQMLAIRLAEASGQRDRQEIEASIFSDRYLIKRPLLQALEPQLNRAPLLLIDEIDRTDASFEAFLLELLSDFQITIPEIGTIKAAEPPIVILTSNRTREIHDALKRRCLYHWVDYPDFQRERAILARKVPGAPAALQAALVGFVQALRQQDLFKVPGVAESLDWAQALCELNVVALNPQIVDDTLGILLKYQEDVEKMRGAKAHKLLEEIESKQQQTALTL